LAGWFHLFREEEILLSWAEIKKFVNSGKKPLNELIEQIDDSVAPDASYMILTGDVTTGTKTLLNITGKGRLKGLVCYESKTSAKPTTVEIIVDGVSSVLTVNKTGTGSSHPQSIIIGNPKDFILNVNGSSTTTDIFIYGCDTYTDVWLPHSNYTTWIPRLESASCSYSSYGKMWLFLNNYIPFKESLVIKSTTNGTGGKYGIGYRLDE
jgi:hypothetical protein